MIDNFGGVALSVGQTGRVEAVEVSTAFIRFDEKQVRQIKTIRRAPGVKGGSHWRIDVDFNLFETNLLLRVQPACFQSRETSS